MKAAAAASASVGATGTARPLNAITWVVVVVTTVLVVDALVVGADVSTVGAAAVRPTVSDADGLHALETKAQIATAIMIRQDVGTTDSFAWLAHRFDVHDLALCEWVSPAASAWRASGTSTGDG